MTHIELSDRVVIVFVRIYNPTKEFIATGLVSFWRDLECITRNLKSKRNQSLHPQHISSEIFRTNEAIQCQEWLNFNLMEFAVILLIHLPICIQMVSA